MSFQNTFRDGNLTGSIRQQQVGSRNMHGGLIQMAADAKAGDISKAIETLSLLAEVDLGNIALRKNAEDLAGNF